jgi:hypothetical protein
LPICLDHSRRPGPRSTGARLAVGKGGEASAAGENTGAAMAGTPVGAGLLTTEAAHIGERGAFRIQHDCHASILDDADRSATDPRWRPGKLSSLLAVFFVHGLLADAQAEGNRFPRQA